MAIAIIYKVQKSPYVCNAHVTLVKI